jgi:hypothetical protein
MIAAISTFPSLFTPSFADADSSSDRDLHDGTGLGGAIESQLGDPSYGKSDCRKDSVI